MERSRLRVSTGMRYALLDPILDELVKEGRIRITVAMKRYGIPSEWIGRRKRLKRKAGGNSRNDKPFAVSA